MGWTPQFRSPSGQKIIDVQIEGGDKARATIAAWWKNVPGALETAFLQEMEETIMESYIECPYDWQNGHQDGTPHLRDTAAASVEIQGNTIIAYGSYSTPYAVIVHEIFGPSHEYPTKAKYLEDPASRRAKVLLENIRIRIASLYADSGAHIYTPTPKADYSFSKYWGGGGDRKGHL